MTGDNVLVLRLVPLTRGINFKPRPHNWTLVPLKGSFQNFRRTPCPFYNMGVPLLGKILLRSFQIKILTHAIRLPYFG